MSSNNTTAKKNIINKELKKINSNDEFKEELEMLEKYGKNVNIPILKSNTPSTNTNFNLNSRSNSTNNSLIKPEIKISLASKNIITPTYRPNSIPSDSNIIRPKNEIITDTELISSLTQKILSLEDKIKFQNEQLIIKQDINSKLLEKQLIMEKLIQSADMNILRDYQNENKILKSQIAEMESFLNDYGLVWVGYRQDLQDSNSDNFNEIWFDMKHMIISLKELNESITTHLKTNIVKVNGIHKFHSGKENSEKLVFYKNGIFFKNGPLREYSLAETKMFCNDILDGFFPSELKGEFPEGLIFEYEDKSSDFFLKQVSNFTSEELVKKLPNQVIKSGQVIPIKNIIATSLEVNKNDKSDELIVVETDIVKMLQDQNFDHKTVTTLRIKLKGFPTLLVKMLQSDLISDLKSILFNEINRLQSNYCSSMEKIELRTNFPLRLYDNDSLTLLNCELVPNANILVKINI